MIGANLVRRLIADGCNVSVFTRNGINLSNLSSIQDQFEVLQGNITDLHSVKTAINAARPDVVFHLACTPFNMPRITAQEHFQVNAEGTLNVLEAVQEFSDTRVVFTGSVAAYGSGSMLSENRTLEPSTLLGASKACASLMLQTYARLHETQTIELRLFAPYGPWEHARRLIPHVIISALRGLEIPMTLGEQRRDYVHVDDVVEALVRAGKWSLPSGTVLNIGSGIGTPVRDIAERILDLMGNPVRLLVGELPTRPDEIMEMSAEITAAQELLDWQPQISLEDGLKMSIAWFTENRELASIDSP